MLRRDFLIMIWISKFPWESQRRQMKHVHGQNSCSCFLKGSVMQTCLLGYWLHPDFRLSSQKQNCINALSPVAAKNIQSGQRAAKILRFLCSHHRYTKHMWCVELATTACWSDREADSCLWRAGSHTECDQKTAARNDGHLANVHTHIGWTAGSLIKYILTRQNDIDIQILSSLKEWINFWELIDAQQHHVRTHKGCRGILAVHGILRIHHVWYFNHAAGILEFTTFWEKNVPNMSAMVLVGVSIVIVIALIIAIAVENVAPLTLT